MRIETIITPTLLPLYDLEGKTVVVIDVLRATTSICVALCNGASALLPVDSEQEAIGYSQKGYLLASEREGMRRAFAHMGNSPSEFTAERVRGREVVYFTTNGTHAITSAAKGERVLMASFLNMGAITSFLVASKPEEILFLCSGWKGLFNIEDPLLAGAIASDLRVRAQCVIECDATRMAMELWEKAKGDLVRYCEDLAHRKRLENLGLGASFYDCLQVNTLNVIPRYSAGRIEAL